MQGAAVRNPLKSECGQFCGGGNLSVQENSCAAQQAQFYAEGRHDG